MSIPFVSIPIPNTYILFLNGSVCQATTEPQSNGRTGPGSLGIQSHQVCSTSFWMHRLHSTIPKPSNPLLCSLVTLGDPTRLLRAIKFFSVINAIGLGTAGVFGCMSISLAQSTRVDFLFLFFFVAIVASICRAKTLAVILIFPRTVIEAIYVFCFGAMLFIFEMHFRRFELFVIMNFGFMCSWRGRASFLLFCGSLCCGLGIIGLIVAIFSLLNGFFNL
jgi:hypothetical protein